MALEKTSTFTSVTQALLDGFNKHIARIPREVADTEGFMQLDTFDESDIPNFSELKTEASSFASEEDNSLNDFDIDSRFQALKIAYITTINLIGIKDKKRDITQSEVEKLVTPQSFKFGDESEDWGYSQSSTSQSSYRRSTAASELIKVEQSTLGTPEQHERLDSLESNMKELLRLLKDFGISKHDKELALLQLKPEQPSKLDSTEIGCTVVSLDCNIKRAVETLKLSEAKIFSHFKTARAECVEKIARSVVKAHPEFAGNIEVNVKYLCNQVATELGFEQKFISKGDMAYCHNFNKAILKEFVELAQNETEPAVLVDHISRMPTTSELETDFPGYINEPTEFSAEQNYQQAQRRVIASKCQTVLKLGCYEFVSLPTHETVARGRETRKGEIKNDGVGHFYVAIKNANNIGETNKLLTIDHLKEIDHLCKQPPEVVRSITRQAVEQTDDLEALIKFAEIYDVDSLNRGIQTASLQSSESALTVMSSAFRQAMRCKLQLEEHTDMVENLVEKIQKISSREDRMFFAKLCDHPKITAIVLFINSDLVIDQNYSLNINSEVIACLATNVVQNDVAPSAFNDDDDDGDGFGEFPSTVTSTNVPGAEFIKAHIAPIYINVLLCEAAATGNVEAARALVKAGANIQTVDGRGCRPVSLACMNGHKVLVSFCKNTPKNKLDFSSKEVENGLILASRFGHAEVIDYLKGFDRLAPQITEINLMKQTPLMIAIENGHLGASEALLTFSKVKHNPIDRDGNNILHYVGRHNRLEIYQAIGRKFTGNQLNQLKIQTNKASEPNGQGQTPANLAAFCKNNQIAGELRKTH
ncbi:ankyrin repeat domain-containing protein [Parashewanella spongiae]|uniref:Ankyrin repeat domain-containing protein n=1 Tax=Parashewanella spongiae TaxID=342950 RepID=A0A3A6TS98_9GAMM|nr:ankyrin repeat domain-containing protein [Parashewanella spongiae]MCL1078567.1 ankyrin repeat domain-containing protein [Parashewanella spongiae]RJY19024.1 ankyrin repeat domain-containing protein [Parashewanella spongiae]